jgi:N-hydroxyarylamine O-acetyltransferase
LDVEKYLERIDYSGSLGPSTQTLRALHRAHMLSVPFENLDIHLGRPIVLDDAALFAKIVGARRGGFCYELNGLFHGLLSRLGFDVQRLSAGVARADGSFGPDFDHMTLIVRLEDVWLADVGFGDSFLEPISLNDAVVSTDPTGAYRVDAQGDSRVMLRQSEDRQWEPQYRFTLRSRELPEYQQMCTYHQTSPESSFTRKRVCSLATETGRITLSELDLITTEAGRREERTMADEDEYRGTLATYFGIVL